MKKINIFYWIFTGLYGAFMLVSSIPDIVSSPDAIVIITTHLGYPTYFIPFIGVAKFLGGIVILVPGFPRLKEWAYAGLFFDLTGAVYSSIAVGDKISQWWPMLPFFGVLAGSYIFYCKKRKAMLLR
ncbi:MAG: DoxX family protein [Bacteroidota bacterium]